MVIESESEKEETPRGWPPETAGLKVRLRDNPGRIGTTTGRTKRVGSFVMVEVDFGPNEKQFRRHDLLEPVEEDQETLPVCSLKAWKPPLRSPA